MPISSILATATVIAAATAIAYSAVQMQSAPRIPASSSQVNENSINRLPVPRDLPIVVVDEAS